MCCCDEYPQIDALSDVLKREDENDYAPLSLADKQVVAERYIAEIREWVAAPVREAKVRTPAEQAQYDMWQRMNQLLAKSYMAQFEKSAWFADLVLKNKAT